MTSIVRISVDNKNILQSVLQIAKRDDENEKRINRCVIIDDSRDECLLFYVSGTHSNYSKDDKKEYDRGSKELLIDIESRRKKLVCKIAGYVCKKENKGQKGKEKILLCAKEKILLCAAKDMYVGISEMIEKINNFYKVCLKFSEEMVITDPTARQLPWAARQLPWGYGNLESIRVIWNYLQKTRKYYFRNVLDLYIKKTPLVTVRVFSDNYTLFALDVLGQIGEK